MVPHGCKLSTHKREVEFKASLVVGTVQGCKRSCFKKERTKEETKKKYKKTDLDHSLLLGDVDFGHV